MWLMLSETVRSVRDDGMVTQVWTHTEVFLDYDPVGPQGGFHESPDQQRKAPCAGHAVPAPGRIAGHRPAASGMEWPRATAAQVEALQAHS